MLEVLNLEFNKLKALPLANGALMHLKKLVLKNNQLESLPEPTKVLENLETLDINHNRCLKCSEKVLKWLKVKEGKGCRIVGKKITQIFKKMP